MKTFSPTDDPARSAIFLLFNATLVQAAARRGGARPNVIVISGPEALMRAFEVRAAVRVDADGIVEAFAPTVDHPHAAAPQAETVLWRRDPEAAPDVLTFRAGAVEERVRIIG